MMPPGKNPSAVFFSPSPIGAAKWGPIFMINLAMEEVKCHENWKDLRNVSCLTFVE